MAIIYSYPPNSNILPTDILICTSTVLVSGKPKNQTKSILIQNLTAFITTSPSNNLNQVLTNGNTSLLDAKIGELYLYDGPNGGYAKISTQDDVFLVSRAGSGTTIFEVDDGEVLTLNNGVAEANILNTLTTNRTYTLPDKSGTIALTSDLLSYVPYAGATQAVNLGTFSLTANAVTTTIDSTVSGLTIGKGGGALASNTALGSNALLANIIGFDNTAVGVSALRNNLGDDNTANGHQALFNNTTGDGNTAIGASALFNNVGGINNIGLGFNARALNAADTNSIVIGYNAVGVGSQSVVIGNTNILTTVLRGKVGVGTTIPLSTIDTTGSISIKSGLTNTSPRPIVLPGVLASGEIRSYSNTNPTADDGFLRLSAGGGSFAVGKSYIDISGYSTIPDMHSNIVFGTTGAEQMRITKEGNILIGTNITIDSSKFTIQSTTQGFLPPRMTNAQRLAIAAPAIGLCVYCIDVVEGLYINKSIGWVFIG